MADLSGWDLAFFRHRLRERAERIKRDPRLRVRTDESDLVQETLRRAVESSEPCRGQSVAKRLAWFFKIQDRVVIDDFRTHHADCRDVGREQVVQQALDESTAEYIAGFEDKEPLPSERVLGNEQQERLATAIDQLPDEQREVVRLMVLEDRTTAEVAVLLDKSEGSVAGLYYRGVKRLKEILDGWPES